MSATATIKSGDTIWGLVKAKNPGATDAEIQKKTQAVLDANGLTWESAKKMHAGDTVKLDAAIDKPAATPAPAPTPANAVQGGEEPLIGNDQFLELLQKYFTQQQQNQPLNDPFSLLGGQPQGTQSFGQGFNDPLGILDLSAFGGSPSINRAQQLAFIDPFAARNLVLGLLG